MKMTARNRLMLAFAALAVSAAIPATAQADPWTCQQQLNTCYANCSTAACFTACQEQYRMCINFES